MKKINYCFVCGKNNPKSLHLKFKNIGDNTVIAEFELEKEYEGYPNIIHGGILAAILDDAMANTIFTSNTLIYTVELNMKYLKRCFIEESLMVKAWIEKEYHRIVETRGEISDLNGGLRTIATGKYYVKGSL